MKKAAIITVAGSSTRFRESINKDCLKCIYFENNYKDSLLYKLVSLCKTYDSIVIVGGYKFEDLKDFINQYLKEFTDKLITVKNDHYADYGSGYSLYLGVKECQKINAAEILFTEGDLFLDKASFDKIINCSKSAVTMNHDPIEAKKAVAFYINEKETIKYIYDTAHSSLFIDEPFLGIYNSGQVWKFTDAAKLFNITDTLNQKELEGTNLVIVQKYFEQLNQSEYEVIGFEQWINCNTVVDYKKSLI